MRKLPLDRRVDYLVRAVRPDDGPLEAIPRRRNLIADEARVALGDPVEIRSRIVRFTA